MLESEIERAVCSYAADLGWINFKFVSPSSRGVPDRIFIKDGHVVFVEFKSPLGQLSAIQEYTQNAIGIHGVEVYNIHSIVDGKALFDELL